MESEIHQAITLQMRCRKVQFAKLTNKSFCRVHILLYNSTAGIVKLFVCLFFSSLMSSQLLFKQCPCKQFLLSSKLKSKLYFQSTTINILMLLLLPFFTHTLLICVNSLYSAYSTISINSDILFILTMKILRNSLKVLYF